MKISRETYVNGKVYFTGFDGDTPRSVAEFLSRKIQGGQFSDEHPGRIADGQAFVINISVEDAKEEEEW